MSNRRDFLRNSATALAAALLPIPALRKSVVIAPKAAAIVHPFHTHDAVREAMARNLVATLDAARRKRNERLLQILEENATI